MVDLSVREIVRVFCGDSAVSVVCDAGVVVGVEAVGVDGDVDGDDDEVEMVYLYVEGIEAWYCASSAKIVPVGPDGR